MRPLNLCLNNHIKRRIRYGDEAPRWLVFVDVDEYIFPVDTSMSISQALMQRPDMCCVQVGWGEYDTEERAEGRGRGIAVGRSGRELNFTPCCGKGL